MAAETAKVALVLPRIGRTLTNWASYSIPVDMFTPGLSWRFEIWRDGRPGSEWRDLVDDGGVMIDDPVEFQIEDKSVLNGRVESITVGASRKGATLILEGRTLAGKLIDFDADPNVSLANVSVVDAMRAMTDGMDFDVGIVVTTAGGPDDVEAAAALSEELSSLRPSPSLPRRQHSGRGTHHTQRLVGNAGASQRVVGTLGQANQVTGAHRAHQLRVDKYHPIPGERIWSLLDKVLTNLGLMAWELPTYVGESQVMSRWTTNIMRTGAFEVLYLAVGTPAQPGLGNIVPFKFTRIEQADGTFRGNILGGSRRILSAGKPAVVQIYGANAVGDSAPARVLGAHDSKVETGYFGALAAVRVAPTVTPDGFVGTPRAPLEAMQVRPLTRAVTQVDVPVASDALVPSTALGGTLLTPNAVSGSVVATAFGQRLPLANGGYAVVQGVAPAVDENGVAVKTDENGRTRYETVAVLDGVIEPQDLNAVPNEYRIRPIISRRVTAASAGAVYRHKFWAPDYTGKTPNGIRRQFRRRAKTIASAMNEAAVDCAAMFRDHDVEEFIVQGHSQPVGNQGAQWLYSVNSLAVVRDDITQSRFQDASRTMLVTRVEFRGDRDSGQTTVVRLHPPHAVKIVPQALPPPGA